MISIIRQFSNNVALSHAYQLAGQVIAFSEPVKSLAAFEIESDHASFPLNVRVKDFELLSQFEFLTSNNSELCYQGEAPFEHRMRSIKCWRSSDMVQLDVDGIPSCRLDLTNECIVILNEQAFDTQFNLELITGPALILLLAQQSIFCLHAGAVSILSSQKEAINIGFLADSGVGKSTLSADMGAKWKQLSDDILPIGAGGAVRLFNDFPQLKLHGARVKNKDLKNNSLNFIICLSSNISDRVVIEKMPPVQSVLSIIRHTVASRLFDQPLLRSHCEFAQSLSHKVPIFKASYPRDYAQLPDLRTRIIELVS